MPEAIGAIIIEAAAPELVGTLIIGSVTTASFVGEVVLIGGAIGLQLLLTKKPDQLAGQDTSSLPSPQSGQQALKAAIAPRIVGLGVVRLGGTYVLFEAASGTSWDIIDFHHGKVAAIQGIYLDDDVVTIDAASGVVDEQGDGRYGSGLLTIKTRLGLATETAYSDVTTALPTIWTSAHRGDGQGSLMLRCGQAPTSNDFPKIFPRGLPKPSVLASCTAIFDPRDNTQIQDDFTTWKVTANPVIQLIFFLTDLDRGMALDWNILIEPALARLMAKADICDEAVTNADGSLSPRYSSNGSYPLDSDPADVISSILDTCDGWISENGDGSLALEVGSYVAPDDRAVIESKHILGCALQYGVADEAVVNEITIDYTEPQIGYKTAPGQPWRNEADISERGKVLSQRLPLPWVYVHSQARRLAKRRDAQNNSALRGTLTTTLYAIRFLGKRWIKVAAPEFPDLADLVIENRGITIDLLNARCSINFISVDPVTIDVFDAATEEGAAPTITANLVSIPAPVPQNPGIITPGLNTGFFLTVFCDSPHRGDLVYQARYRFRAADALYTGVWVEEPINRTIFDTGTITYFGFGKRVFFSSPFVSGHLYEVQVRSYPPAGSASAYSASANFTG